MFPEHRGACRISDPRLGQISMPAIALSRPSSSRNGHTAPALPACSVTGRLDPAMRPA